MLCVDVGYGCAQVRVCALARGDARDLMYMRRPGHRQAFPLSLSTLVFQQGLSLNLELAISTGLVSR